MRTDRLILSAAAYICCNILPCLAQSVSVEMVSVNSVGERADLDVTTPCFTQVLRSSISADGSVIAFTSAADNLVANDTNNAPDVFVRDRTSGETLRVSVPNIGLEDDPSLYEAHPDHPLHCGSGYPTVSENGRKVLFASWAKLTSEYDPRPGMPDLYVHDRDTGETRLINLGPNGPVDTLSLIHI